jgi:3-hydroxy-9,10-secoandrosta-1,3,5(10)-triene-9,17-dione monooxygenase reductase component
MGEPVHVQPQRFREVLGHLPTGVVVVAAETAAGPAGMAVNSFTSVSLEPPLVLFCPAKSSATWPGIRAAGRFCANVLAGEHAEVSRRFASKDADRFAGIAWRRGSHGPRIEGVVAWLECELEAEHEAGDHTIAVARVRGLDVEGSSVPLVFHRGAYASLAAAG